MHNTKSTTTLPLTGIDSHAHIFARDMTFVSGRRYTPKQDALLADYLAHLDAIGFSHGVLVQPSFLGTDNRYMLAALAQETRRLRGVAVVDATTPLASLQQMAATGVTGIRLNLIGQPNPDFSDKQFVNMLEQVASLNWHIELHQHVALLPELIRQLLPFGTKIVIDHFGRPDAGLGIEQPDFKHVVQLAAQQQLWVKISGLYRLSDNEAQNTHFARSALKAWLDAFDSQRLVIGSDWPHTQYEDRTDFNKVMAELLTLTDEFGVTEALTKKNPALLFGF